ncbi:hypothetical protein AO275_14415 [Pseudomonas viridiflava]|nr:hypothetical protein AO275_14415 [Pseudomonas viridiflava]
MGRRKKEQHSLLMQFHLTFLSTGLNRQKKFNVKYVAHLEKKHEILRFVIWLVTPLVQVIVGIQISFIFFLGNITRRLYPQFSQLRILKMF